MFEIDLCSANIKEDASKTLYGLFFEDINHAADGGISAELISNNSFEYQYINYNDRGEKVEILPDKLKFWNMGGYASFVVLKSEGMNENNPSFLRCKVNGDSYLYNMGYPFSSDTYGIALNQGEYKFSFFARNIDFDGQIKVYLKSEKGIESNVVSLIISGNEFKQYEGLLSVKRKADTVFMLEFIGSGSLDLDYFSLLDNDTVGDSRVWTRGRLKRRFVEVLRDCSPKFIRFPGGCIVEGDVEFSNMYMWKNTIGKLHERKQNPNTWQYMQSYALGFYEYFLLCEELNAEPLPVVPLGLLCQIRCGQRGEGDKSYKIGTDEFQKYVIDNAAHLIYYALGSLDSNDDTERYWANERAKSGHPSPFNMHLLGLGNENWGDIYFENLDFTLNALTHYSHNGKKVDLLKKFNVKIVASCGVDIRPFDTNESTKRINSKYKKFIIDEHCYNSRQWFLDNFHRYDFYDRDNAKVFMGEYGMHSNSDGRGRLNGISNLNAALSEAVFLTGCERNSDVVVMTAYAPLFAKTQGYKWTPDLIWFNNRDIMRTPSYFVQKMFANNYGNKIVQTPCSNSKDISGGIFIGTFDADVLIRSVRVSNNGKTIYKHDFKDGLGAFKVYPDSQGGDLTLEGLRLNSQKKLNGYYLDADFGDCEYEFVAQKLGGREGFIFGIGVKNVKAVEEEDKDEHSIWLNYGALNDKVALEKRYDYMRVAFEVFDELKADFSYDTFILSLKSGMLKAERKKQNKLQRLFEKYVYRTHEKVFFSATFDGKSYYLKAVNVDNDNHELALSVDNATKIELTTLCGELEQTNSIDNREGVKENIIPTKKALRVINGKVRLILPKNSVSVIKTL